MSAWHDKIGIDGFREKLKFRKRVAVYKLKNDLNFRKTAQFKIEFPSYQQKMSEPSNDSRMTLKFQSTNSKDKIFKTGDQFIISEDGFENTKISERFCKDLKDWKVLIGRENHKSALDFPLSKHNKYLSKK